MPLDAEGKAEAKDVAQDLADETVAKVYSSDLSRALFTADMIAKQHSLKPVRSMSLRPWNLGDMQGKAVNVPKLDALLEHPSRKAPHGESFDQFKTRFLTKLRSVLDEAQRTVEQGVIVVVAHTRNLMLTRAWMKEGMADSHAVDWDVMKDFDSQVETGEGYRLTLGKSGWKETDL